SLLATCSMASHWPMYTAPSSPGVHPLPAQVPARKLVHVILDTYTDLVRVTQGSRWVLRQTCQAATEARCLLMRGRSLGQFLADVFLICMCGLMPYLCSAMTKTVYAIPNVRARRMPALEAVQ